VLKNNKHFSFDNFRRRGKLEIGIFTNVKFECSFHCVTRHVHLWQVIVNMASDFFFLIVKSTCYSAENFPRPCCFRYNMTFRMIASKWGQLFIIDFEL